MDAPSPRALVTGNPVAIAHAVIGDAWSQLILRESWYGVRRFNDFAAALGAPRTVLSGRLARLCEGGVLRTVTPEGSKRAEYRLTDMGLDLFGVAVMQALWEAEFTPSMPDRYVPHLVFRNTGERVMPVVLDAPFGVPIDPHDVLYVPGPTLRARPAPTLRRWSADKGGAGRNVSHRSVEIIGDYWSWAVVGCAYLSVRRFDEMIAATGMAPNVLSDRLARLVAAGLLRRTPYQDNPPRFEYRLQRAGFALHPLVMAMHGWAERWLCGIEQTPVALYHRGSGTRILPTVCDASSGRPIRAYDVRWVEEVRSTDDPDVGDQPVT